MKKVLLSSLGLLSCLLLTTGCSKQVASIENEPITQTQFYNELKSEFGETTLQTLLINDVLERKYGYITEEEVNKQYQEIENQYTNKKDLDKILSNMGYNSSDSYKKAIKQNLLIHAMVQKNLDLSEKDYQEYFSYMIDFDLIQLDTKETANIVIEKLENGTSFKQLVSEYSLDIASSTYGGNIGLIDSRDHSLYPNELLEKAITMKNSEISKKPIETDKGLYIVRMNNNLKYSNIPLDEFKKQIEDYVIEQKVQDSKYIQKQLTNLLNEFDVKIMDDDLSNALYSFTSLKE